MFIGQLQDILIIGVVFPDKVISDILRFKVGIRRGGWDPLIRSAVGRSAFLLLPPEGRSGEFADRVKGRSLINLAAIQNAPDCTRHNCNLRSNYQTVQMAQCSVVAGIGWNRLEKAGICWNMLE